MPNTRSRELGRAATERIHTMAIGATDGNIMAVIMTTQMGRNVARDIPIVPGPTFIVPAHSMVAAHASAAMRHSPIHPGRSCCSCMPSGGLASTRVSALVRKVRHETVGARELCVPVVVVTVRAGFRLGHGLRDGAKERVGDNWRVRAVHADHLFRLH